MSFGGVALRESIDVRTLAVRPMAKGFAQRALSQAGTLLVQQGAANVSSDPLSVTSTQEEAAAVFVQRIADDLAAVNNGGDPVDPDLADEVQSAVSLALGLERTIADEVSDAAKSAWHALGLPAESKPDIQIPGPFGLSWTTVAVLVGAAYFLTRESA